MKHPVLFAETGEQKYFFAPFFPPSFLPQWFQMTNLCWIIICRPCSKHTASPHWFISICSLTNYFFTAWSRNIVPGWDISLYHHFPLQGFIAHCISTIGTSITPNCLWLFLTKPEALPRMHREPCLWWKWDHTYRNLLKQLCFLPSVLLHSHHIKTALQQYSAKSNTPQSLLWFQKLPCPYFSSLKLIHLMTELPIIWLSILKSKPVHNISQRKNVMSLTEITATNLS